MTEKTYEKIKSLNKIYSPLIESAKKCRSLFEEKNVAARFVWANGHYEEFKQKYIREDYPIPVIEAEGVGDVGFNITGCFFEGYFPKERLLSFDLGILKNVKNPSLYGESDCLADIYNSEMKDADIKQLIRNSAENNIAVGFSFARKDLGGVIDTLLELTSVRQTDD